MALLSLSAHDASVFALVARAPDSKRDVARELLRDLSDSDAREAAQVFLGDKKESEVSPAARELVTAMREWLGSPPRRGRQPSR